MNTKYIIFLMLLGMSFLACGDNDDAKKGIENPTDYEFLRDGMSTVSFSGQTTRIKMATELTDAMKDFDSSVESIKEMYANETAAGGDANPYSNSELNESTKSIKSKVAASADFFSANTVESANIKGDIEGWIESQVSEVFVNENQLAQSGVAGQIADGSSVRYVNAKGLEYNQAVAKSLIGALMVDQICNNYLSTSVLDAGENLANNNNSLVEEGKAYTTMEHKWDEAYGYLFGVSTDVVDPLSTLGEDNFLNKYLSRVEEDDDFTGIANNIFQAFKLGRAAIVANDYETRNVQAEIIRKELATVVGVRAVYYLQAGKNALANNDLGGAFHDLSEGFGFVYSLRFLREVNSNSAYFTRSDVDAYIADLTKNNGFWDIDGTTLDQISESIALKFDFTVAEAAE